MFSSLRRGLQTIDFYQVVPSEYSEGTISGACISIVSIVILVALSLFSVMKFSSAQIDSDLIIDQKHLASKLRVNIDIEFVKYPCSMLSLDIENELKVHQVNIGGSIKKYTVPQGQLYDDSGIGSEEKYQRILDDLGAGKGCRMRGYFEIDRVPGNFHFSSHGYSMQMHRLFSRGQNNFDLSHIIHSLWFGEEFSNEIGSNSLGSFTSHKEIKEKFMGITYAYFLDIVQLNTVAVGRDTGIEAYVYTARLNEVILDQIPIALFKYQTNPMTVLYVYYWHEWHTLFIQLVGILGGIFTVAAIFDHLVHSSIRFLVEKHRLGKLK